MKKLKRKAGGSLSGYLPGSPDRNNPYNVIPSNLITMNTVPHDILGIPDKGTPRVMKADSGLHKFTGADSVLEIPMMKQGGIHIKKSHEGKFTAYKKRTGKTTEEALHSRDKHVRAMAQFAKNARKWKHQDGGELPIAQWGGQDNFAWYNPPMVPPATNFPSMYKADQMPADQANSYQGVPIQKGSNGQYQAKTNSTWGPNVEAATAFTGSLSMFANQLGKIPDSRIYNRKVDRATSDAQFQTYNPTLKRGYIDQNSGMMAPDHQTLTQFANAPIPEYYGMLPMYQMGGLPDLGGPQNPMQSIDAQVNAGSGFPSTIPAGGYTPARPNPATASTQGVQDQDFMTYMAHQQGEAGIKAIMKAARTGKDWRDFYKGENLDRNMQANVNKQEFFKKYDEVNPTTFIDYWKDKFSKQVTKWNKKETPYDGLIGELAPQFGFSPQFVKGVVGIESGFDSTAHTGSYKGLMQLSDKEAKTNGAKDVFNPIDNLMAGLKSMAAKRDRMNASPQFKEGGEYDLSEAEISRLKKLGYDVEEIS